MNTLLSHYPENTQDSYTLDRAKVLRCGQRPQRSALDPFGNIDYSKGSSDNAIRQNSQRSALDPFGMVYYDSEWQGCYL